MESDASFSIHKTPEIVKLYAKGCTLCRSNTPSSVRNLAGIALNLFAMTTEIVLVHPDVIICDDMMTGVAGTSSRVNRTVN